MPGPSNKRVRNKARELGCMTDSAKTRQRGRTGAPRPLGSSQAAAPRRAASPSAGNATGRPPCGAAARHPARAPPHRTPRRRPASTAAGADPQRGCRPGCCPPAPPAAPLRCPAAPCPPAATVLIIRRQPAHPEARVVREGIIRWQGMGVSLGWRVGKGSALRGALLGHNSAPGHLGVPTLRGDEASAHL